MVSHADPSRHIVRTQRTCFSVGSLSVYIERFLSPHQGLQVLYELALTLTSALTLFPNPDPNATPAPAPTPTPDPLQVLYVQAEQAERDRPLDLPPPLRQAVEIEVTGERQYSAYHLSLAAARSSTLPARARRATPTPA
jgi:hypothetical protein